jgi:formylmethanofuran dehydrogenase subunit A
MSEILIKNGFVFDPLNNINGEKMDIFIKDGKIVDKVSSKAKVIDASNMVVMPGGVDIHSHIAGSKVNAGRILRPEDHVKDFEVKTKVTRSGVGYSVPSTFTTGYRYAKMGYTTVFEPATPPLKTRHTHEELRDIPIIDKGCFPLLGNNWFIMEYLKENKLEECAAYVSWLLNAIKGYAIKIVNPGGTEAWGWGKGISHLDEEVPYFNVTPKEIVRWLCKINNILNLPHPIHVHTNNLGKPGNYVTTIETMDAVKDLSKDGKVSIHVTHVQFNGFAGTSWLNLASGAPEIANYINKNTHVEIDIGQVTFSDTTTMTADGPFQYILYLLSREKWVNADVEAETGAGVVPFRYKKSNYVNAIQWGIGLELALLIKDPWKIHMTTDHPNGGPFTHYPKVIAWLMSRKAREKTLNKINKNAKRRLDLPGIDREYTLYEIAIITRAATAKSLGLKNKGHLGVGADADVAIYNLNYKSLDPSKDYKLIKKAFKQTAYTIKDGEIVAKNGEIVSSSKGKIYWVNSKVAEDIQKSMLNNLKMKFEEYYTVKMENYIINESYLHNSFMLNVQSEV